MEYSDSPQPEKKGFPCGCVAMGCLGVLLVTAIVTGVVFWFGYRFYQSQIAKYTSPDPLTIPTVELTEEESQAVDDRLEAFKTAIEAGEIVDPIILTEEEINAKLSQDNDFEGRLYIDLEEDEISAQVSIPLDGVLPGTNGRFFNGDITVHVEIEDGEMIVMVEDAVVNGQPVPEDFMAELRKQNLTEEFMSDPDVQKMFAKVKAVRVEKDQLVLIPAPPEETEVEEEAVEAAAEPDDSSQNRIEAEAEAEVGSKAEEEMSTIN